MPKPLIEGRIASLKDVQDGVAVFCSPGGRSVPFSFGRSLPISASISNPDLGDAFPLGRVVEIVQAEILGGKIVTLGVLDQDQKRVCQLEDVTLID